MKMYEYQRTYYSNLEKINKLGRAGFRIIPVPLGAANYYIFMEREIDPENDAILDPVEIGVEDAPIDYSGGLTASGYVYLHQDPEPRQIGTGPYTI